MYGGTWVKQKFKRARNGRLTLHYILNNNNNNSLCGLKFDYSPNVIKDSDRKISYIECRHCVNSFKLSKINLDFELTPDSHIEKLSKIRIKNPQRDKPVLIESKYHLIQTICPQCSTKVCYYSNGISKDHYCTVCNNLVNFETGLIVA